MTVRNTAAPQSLPAWANVNKRSLKKMQSVNKHCGFFPWLGGKSRLSVKIVNLIQYKPHTAYVEVFAGAAHVFFRKPESKSETLNDLNGDLVNLYRVVQNHLEEFVRHFKFALVSRDEFERLRAQEPESLTDIQRASRFFYLQKLAFGGKLGGVYGTSTMGPPRMNLLRIEEDLSQAHLRLARVNIERLDWRECLWRYDRPHTLFYLDPPYHGSETDYGKGLFKQADFEKMAKILAGLEGQWILSLNDNPEVRRIFAQFHFEEVALNYSVCKGKPTKAKELFITPN